MKIKNFKMTEEFKLMAIANKIIKEHLEGLSYSEKKGILSYIDFEINERLRKSLKNGNK